MEERMDVVGLTSNFVSALANFHANIIMLVAFFLILLCIVFFSVSTIRLDVSRPSFNSFSSLIFLMSLLISAVFSFLYSDRFLMELSSEDNEATLSRLSEAIESDFTFRSDFKPSITSSKSCVTSDE